MVDPTLVTRVEELLAGPHPVPLVYAGDPVLRQPAAPYHDQLPQALLAELLLAMRETMLAAPGVGLAAPQIGLSLRIAVLEDDADLPEEVALALDRTPLPYRVIINPTYQAIGEEFVEHYEGCLSVPGYRAVVARPRRIRLQSQDEQLQNHDEELQGWPARIVQHETDHLDGILYLDRAITRSLSTEAHHLARWAGPDLEPARQALGF